MFVTNMPGVDLEFFPDRYLLEYAFQFLFNVSVSHHLASVFAYPDQVVFTDKGAVAEVIQARV